jgi:hypothetical protein
VLAELEMYKAAEELYCLLLEACEKHSTQALSMARELVLVLSARGRYGAVEDIRHSVLKTDEEVLEEEHPQTIEEPR